VTTIATSNDDSNDDGKAATMATNSGGKAWTTIVTKGNSNEQRWKGGDNNSNK
jgi:hypothetical protein